jgi:peptidoglycan/xylan/chitin deacetylase (PgdA/CDA1 family)
LIVPILLAAAFAASWRWNWWRPRRWGLPTPMYHKIGFCPPTMRLPYLWVTPGDFRKQLDYLKTRGYTSMLLSELREAEGGRRPMPEKPVVLTFDDGFANNYDLAFPLLKEYGMKANIFLVYEKMGTVNSWDKEFEPTVPLMSWEQAFEMRDSGLVEFGSHTLRHPRLTAVDEALARKEIAESKAALEAKLGREVLGFAYPFGDGADAPAIRRLAREAGYRYDFSLFEGISPWPWNHESEALRRLLIAGQDSMLDFHLKMTRGKSKLSLRFWEFGLAPTKRLD